MNDRHPKWTPVEPGFVIPAGQPYRVEMRGTPADPHWTDTATECVRGSDFLIGRGRPADYFIDSRTHRSWRQLGRQVVGRTSWLNWFRGHPERRQQ